MTFADMLPGAGLRLARMSEATRAALGRWMPETHIALPVDTGSFHEGTSGDGLSECIRAFMADEDVGAIVVPMTTQPDMAGRTALFPPLGRAGRKAVALPDDGGGGGRCLPRRDARGGLPLLRPDVGCDRGDPRAGSRGAKAVCAAMRGNPCARAALARHPPCRPVR